MIGAGDRIVPVSGYRSLEEQVAIYQDSLGENGRDFTEKYVALPDHSEHQTGLAIDLGLAKEEIDFIRPDFPYEGICQKFRENAAAYGWIERYAKDKTRITGIAQEPWHFRYVGCPHAAIMAEKNLALEEYMDFLKQFGMEHPYCYQAESGAKTEIYYQPVQGEQTTICIPDGYTVRVSGNNMDGFLVTQMEENYA